MPPEKPADEQAPHATQPADERPRGASVINPNDQARWLALADTALRHAPTEQEVAEMEALARKEQASSSAGFVARLRKSKGRASPNSRRYPVMARTSKPTSTSHCRSRRLLFVDDEEGIRTTLPAILERRGFDVRVAATVPEALAEMESHKFDVLVSDLNIGEDGNGFTVIRAMRNTHPQCVAILLTGYPTFESSVQAIEDEVDGYVVKPADINSLVSTIDRKLRTRQERGH